MTDRLNERYTTLYAWRTAKPLEYAAVFGALDADVQTLLNGRFDFRHIFVPKDAPDFLTRLSARASYIIGTYNDYYGDLIDRADDLLAAMMADETETTRTVHPAPNGAVDTAYSEGAEKTVQTGAAGANPERLRFLTEEYRPIIDKFLSEFESLFLGVLE